MRAAKILIACCFAVTVVDAEPPRKNPSAPDIYLVTIDKLRADHVHCYGYERVQTPALDALAKDGIRFAQAFTPAPSRTLPILRSSPVYFRVRMASSISQCRSRLCIRLGRSY